MENVTYPRVVSHSVGLDTGDCGHCDKPIQGNVLQLASGDYVCESCATKSLDESVTLTLTREEARHVRRLLLLSSSNQFSEPRLKLFTDLANRIGETM